MSEKTQAGVTPPGPQFARVNSITWETLMKEALKLIKVERKRQIEEEGHALDHDDRHTRGELPIAAVDLLLAPTDESRSELNHPSDAWGLVERHGKGDDIRRLAIAGALVVAEMERILRKEVKVHQWDEEHVGVAREAYSVVKTFLHRVYSNDHIKGWEELDIEQQEKAIMRVQDISNNLEEPVPEDLSVGDRTHRIIFDVAARVMLGFDPE